MGTGLDSFKRALEDTCSISSWNPTSSQLERIAKQLARAKPITSGDVGIVVNGICPDTTFRFLEGVDNSDLRTLLALAIQVADVKG
jgi:hypothetical protein